MNSANDILNGLDRFGISITEHGQITLISHLKGTFEILKKWNCDEEISLAGLCHSIYGTESFLKVSATLDNREYVQNLIGDRAERLAYLFGAHKKESLWENLNRDSNFFIMDRFLDKEVTLSDKELADLITITLANWLEQRPRSKPEHHFIRQAEFIRSKIHLPKSAFEDFCTAYGLKDL
nr:hypothetical protein BHI3_06450 [Bacteriovorax sp. HI3]